VSVARRKPNKRCTYLSPASLNACLERLSIQIVPSQITRYHFPRDPDKDELQIEHWSAHLEAHRLERMNRSKI